MDFRRSSQLKFLLMELLYLTHFLCASCYLLWRHELNYPLIQPFLLEYMKRLSCDSESDDDFDGYLGPEDGPVSCAIVPEVVEREGLCSPVRRSLSTDDLTAAEISELPESPFTSSVSPIQGQHSSGSPLSLTSETNSSHSTIFNSATKPNPQVCKNTLRYIHASNVITQKCHCLHESRESWSHGTNAFKVVL